MKQIRQDTMDLRADLQKYKQHEEKMNLVASNTTRTAHTVSRAVLPETHRVRSSMPSMQPSEVKAIGKGPLSLLTAIIEHDPNGCTETQLAVLTGYKATSRYEFLRQLKLHGYTIERGDRVLSTDLGRSILPGVDPLPTGDELRQISLTRVSKGERMILELAIEFYPHAVTKNTIQDKTGYKPTSVYEYTRQLLARELIEDLGRGDIKASSTLFE